MCIIFYIQTRQFFVTFLGWLNAAFKGLSDLQTKGLKGRFESPGMYITIYVYTKIIQVVFVVFLSLYLGWDLQVAPQFFFGVYIEPGPGLELMGTAWASWYILPSCRFVLRLSKLSNFLGEFTAISTNPPKNLGWNITHSPNDDLKSAPSFRCFFL